MKSVLIRIPLLAIVLLPVAHSNTIDNFGYTMHERGGPLQVLTPFGNNPSWWAEDTGQLSRPVSSGYMYNSAPHFAGDWYGSDPLPFLLNSNDLAALNQAFEAFQYARFLDFYGFAVPSENSSARAIQFYSRPYGFPWTENFSLIGGEDLPETTVRGTDPEERRVIARRRDCEVPPEPFYVSSLAGADTANASSQPCRDQDNDRDNDLGKGKGKGCSNPGCAATPEPSHLWLLAACFGACLLAAPFKRVS